MAEYLDSYSSSRLGGNLLLPCCPGESRDQSLCETIKEMTAQHNYVECSLFALDFHSPADIHHM